ncbi:hypothetical protein ACWGH8_36390 [Nonomuraea muscovyensis]|uniref:DUF4352 domain-containing protein n=1 Tax=Nonomuraea muscovyensis TaxID=1124761 RepID=A0A7X0EZV3_9ACTN|nr:hypothetical protein [Nonomuraea muscovyensis]MBB6350238.1 hypothetical protein [Nonomuraea muscovyensis]
MTATRESPARADGRRGRRAGRGGSPVLNAVVGLLLAGGAVGLQSLALSENDASAPLTYVGDKGRQVDARRFTVRLDSVAVAKAIKVSATKTVETDHLFLVVRASAKSSLRPYHLAQPVLMDAEGHKFTATDRVDSARTLADKWVQPDIWVSGPFFFEVPASALPDAKVVFALPGSAIPVEPYAPEAEIDLGLDEQAARKLAAAPQDVYSLVEK